MTIHDLAWLHDPSHFTRRGVSFFDRGLDLALREADLIVCPSTATLDDCRKQGFEEARLRMVPMGVSSSPADDASVSAARSKYGLKNDYALWTGTIEPRKNLPRLLDAFRQLDTDADLVLAGPEGWNEDLEAAVGPVKDRVRILGFVPHADLTALYRGARVFCFPSLSEGFGLPVLEAMAQGTPVVTSLGTSTEEVAGDAGVLVDPRDPASIRDGIASVLQDQSLARKLSDAARLRAALYPWDRTAEGLEAAYREAAA